MITQTKKLSVDIDLLKKYDKPGPRYTSYPTAPQFSADFSIDIFKNQLANPVYRERALSLYFHIPFCHQLCYYCGCTMMVARNAKKVADYLQYVLKEIDLLSANTGKRIVRQMHWGGGTPTFLTPDQIRILGEVIRKHYTFADNAEISVEIDPRKLTKAHLLALREVGFNRMSMGVQDFHEPTQKAINRLQPEILTRNFVAMGRELGFESVNLDFIYGLPFQTEWTFNDTLDRLLTIHPDRLALFNYAHVPWLKKHQQIIDTATLPGPEEKLKILKMCIERLTEAGYVFIGMDHFALPEDELAQALENKSLYRNFQGYSTHADCDIIAHGMSGISQTAETYAQSYKTLPEYYKMLDQGKLPVEKGFKLSEDDLLRREVIMRIMCDFSLDFKAINRKFKIDFHDYFAGELKELQAFTGDGLLSLEDDSIQIKENGVFVIRNIAMTFDKYLKINKKQRFSRTV